MKHLMFSFMKSINLENNRFYKIYLSILSLLNLIYFGLEIYKSKLTHIALIKEEVQRLDFMRIINISKINTIIEYLIICLSLFCLIRLIVKKHNNLKQFLIIHFIYLSFGSLISLIISIVLSVPFGNLIQQFFIIYEITIIVLICFILKALFKKLNRFVVNLK